MKMKISDMINNLMQLKAEYPVDTDPEVRFFIIAARGEQTQVFVEDVSAYKEGVEILLG